VQSNEKRQLIYKVFRDFAGRISDLAHCLIIARERTLLKINDPDLFDRSSRNQISFEIDLEEISNDKKNEETSIYSKEEIQIQKEIKLEERKQDFCMQLFEKRMLYFKNVILKSGKIENFYHEDHANRLNNLYKRIKESKYILPNLLDLCNNDRHYYLRDLASFINYLYYSEDTLYNEFLYPSESTFILETHFYGWLLNSDNYKYHYNLEIYDFVKDYKFWEQGSYDFRNNKNACFLRHLIFVLIYNLTFNTSGLLSKDHRSIKLSDICSKMKPLNYSCDQIKKEILNIYFNQDNEITGFLELDIEVTSNKYTDLNELKDDMKIWLTPKAVCLLKYISNKFLYGIVLCKLHSISCTGERLDYDVKKPITPYMIQLPLKLVCNLAKMHLIGLYEIKNNLKGKAINWLNYFKTNFCITSRGIDETPNEVYGKMFNFEILVNNYIKFLIRNSKLPGYGYLNIMKVIGKYKEILVAFLNIAGKLDSISDLGELQQELRCFDMLLRSHILMNEELYNVYPEF
jgi:hypothetical protein